MYISVYMYTISVIKTSFIMHRSRTVNETALLIKGHPEIHAAPFRSPKIRVICVAWVVFVDALTFPPLCAITAAFR